ncbi:hypothetical protein J3A83DRAFT_4417908 [Scleroderma citrinum]
MTQIQVQCPIHLDSVPLKQIHVFKCGHGFCIPCLNAHFAQRSGGILCPTCRKPIKRRDAFPLYLEPARSMTQFHPPSSPLIPTSRASSPSAVIDLTTFDDETSSDISQLREKNRVLILEVRSFETRLRRAHVRAEVAEESLERFETIYDRHMNTRQDLERENLTLKSQLDGLQLECSRLGQVIVHLKGQNESLEKRCKRGEELSARLSGETERLEEDLAKLKAELQKASATKNQALKEAQEERDRVKVFEGRCQRFKQQLELKKKKRKALKNENKQLQPSPTVEDESLVVINANQPDRLGQNKPGTTWLEDACLVRGDRLDIDDEITHSEQSDDDVPSGLPDIKGKQRASWMEWENMDDLERPLPADRGYPSRKPLARFSSDWSLGSDAELSLGASKRRKNEHRPMGSKLYRVKPKTRSENGPSSSNTSAHPSDKLVGSCIPLSVDKDGHVKGTVALGSRRKLNSRN